MDFIILKVNGVDISNATHEETLRAFAEAKDPVLVEVKRRGPNPPKEAHQNQNDDNHYHVTDVATSSSCTSTCNGTSIEHTNNYTSTEQTPSFDCDEDYAELTNELYIDEDDDLLPDIEYEDVILRRSSCEQRIGLTLCYGPPDEHGVTGVFVGDIEQNSIGAKDGRIHEGDQILQINNQDIRTREDAKRLFSENKYMISLLLCRPCTQCDDGFVDEDRLKSDNRLSNSKINVAPSLAQIQEEGYDDEDSMVTDTATLPSLKEKEGKDSGVGHDSGPYDEVTEPEYDSSHYQIPDTDGRLDDSHIYEGMDNLRLESSCNCKNDIIDMDTLYQQMDALCALIEKHQMLARLQSSTSSDSSPTNSLPSANLNRPLPPVKSQQRTSSAEEAPASPRSVPKMGSQSTECQRPTLDISHTTAPPQYLELPSPAELPLPPPYLPKPEKKRRSKERRSSFGHSTDKTKLELGHDPQGSTLCLVGHDHNGNCYQSRNKSGSRERDSSNSTRADKNRDRSRSSESSSSGSKKKKSKSKSSSSSALPPPSGLKSVNNNMTYTHEQQLAMTIALQQRLLLEQMKGSTSTLQTIQASDASSTVKARSNHDMEWVMKRRSDGSRYVTRRPIRNKLLSERKKKLEDERDGLTTDDDTMSEIKMGRYWSREQRKEQYQKAKEYRRRKQFVKQSTNNSKVPREVASVLTAQGPAGHKVLTVMTV